MIPLLLRCARPRRHLPDLPWPAAAARQCASAGSAAAGGDAAGGVHAGADGDAAGGVHAGAGGDAAGGVHAGAGGDDAGRLVAELLEGVLRRRDRGAVARAITLCESRAPADWAPAAALLRALAAAAPPSPAALRIGVCGPPGAGKSALIDALGCLLADAGRRPAVLCVDPSSSLGAGGSILGDKARMAALSSRAGAFVRPSPSRGALGGVGRATHEAVAVVEAAGHDRVLIETVGLGQSETQVTAVADVSVLCLPSTGGGDGLQALKRGIMEAADVVAITKVDGGGAVREAALRAAADARGALGLQRPRRGGWAPRVLLCSARTGEGLPELAAAAAAHFSSSIVRPAGDCRPHSLTTHLSTKN